jgi:hypothetical protein
MAVAAVHLPTEDNLLLFGEFKLQTIELVADGGGTKGAPSQRLGLDGGSGEHLGSDEEIGMVADVIVFEGVVLRAEVIVAGRQSDTLVEA